MKNNILYFFLLAFCSINLYSQNIVLNGKVADKENGIPLQYVNIYIKNTTIGTVTNIEGNYSLMVPLAYKNDTIIFKFIGYHTVDKAIKRLQINPAIRLSKYTIVLNSTEIKATKTDPFKIWKKARYQEFENRYDSSYEVSLFTRQIILKDSVFEFYRKNKINGLTYKGMVFWGRMKGQIIADNILYTGKLFDSINLNKFKYYELIFPYDVIYHRPKEKYEKRILKKYVIKIDTVFYTDKNKIYVIDYYEKKINATNLSKIYTIINKSPTPYNMVFDESLAKLGENFIDNDIFFIRYYIDANNNYNIIKRIKLSTWGVSLNKQKYAFEYAVEEYTNTPDSSNLKHSITYTEKKYQIKNKTVTRFKSMFEIFCTNENYHPEKKTFTDTSDLSIQYLRSIHINDLTNNIPININTWNDSIPFYIKPDSLEQNAIEQIENTIKLQNEK